MRADADFFCQPIEELPAEKNEVFYNLDIHAIIIIFFYLHKFTLSINFIEFQNHGILSYICYLICHI